MSRRAIIAWKVVVWALCLEPLAQLVVLGLTARLGANPIEKITLVTGITTLRLLLLSLAVTPLRQLTGAVWLIRFRRLLGLFAFFYGSLHLTTYVWLDKFFDFREIVHDVLKRPFITMGMLAFVLLVPLAATSTAWSIRKLGGKRWNRLHRLVYISGMAAVVHFWWKVKADHREPALYAAALALLLGYRLWATMKRREPARAPAGAPSQHRVNP